MKTCAVRRIALIILIGVLCLASVSAFAAKQQSKMQSQMQMQSQPAMMGAGGAPVVQASNVTNQGYIYTSDVINSAPQPITGSIQISAVGSTTGTTGKRANVYSTFNYNNSNYTVRLNNVMSTGNQFGGVAILRPVFGNTGVTVAGLNLPQTLAYTAVFGNATITKDGQTIASNQPAVVMVTQGLHDPSNLTWFSTADPNSQEIHLIVPGCIQTGGTAVSGFPNGFFYVYWPGAAINMSNVGGMVQTSNIGAVPAAAGRGEGVIGTLNISITDSGIQKAVATSPAGAYRVIITNNSSTVRGLAMTGNDLCCSQFIRFSQPLKPGESQSFQFFFAPGKVILRDVVCATKTSRSWTNVGYGGFSSSITFE